MNPTQRPYRWPRLDDPTYGPDLKTRLVDPIRGSDTDPYTNPQSGSESYRELTHNELTLTSSTYSRRRTPQTEPPCNEHCLQPSNRLVESVASSRAASQRVLPLVEYYLTLSTVSCRVFILDDI
ncbi:hypothetical protein ACFX2I_038837 [Malus domestica]